MAERISETGGTVVFDPVAMDLKRMIDNNRDHSSEKLELVEKLVSLFGSKMVQLNAAQIELGFWAPELSDLLGYKEFNSCSSGIPEPNDPGKEPVAGGVTDKFMEAAKDLKWLLGAVTSESSEAIAQVEELVGMYKGKKNELARVEKTLLSLSAFGFCSSE